MPDEIIKKDSKIFNKSIKDRIEIVSVGVLEQMYKSPDIAIKAIKILTDKGFDCRLTWVGDGMYRENMVAFSNEMGVSEKVSFIGRVNPLEVRTYLEKADIFMLVSRTEGLPRAVIEAMAMGLPCIGTRVGGIPELLDKKALVSPNNAEELAKKIEMFISDCTFTTEQAQRNLLEASAYKKSILTQNRENFYKALINQSL